MVLVCPSNCGSRTFTDSTAVSPSRTSSPVSVKSAFLRSSPFVRVRVDRARERRLEAGEVRAAFVRVDVVDEGEDVLVVAVVVLQRELDADVVALGLDVDDLRVQRLPRCCSGAGRTPSGRPCAWKVSVFSCPSRSSVSVIVTPLFRNDSSRRRVGERVVVVEQLGEDLAVRLEPDLRAASPSRRPCRGP